MPGFKSFFSFALTLAGATAFADRPLMDLPYTPGLNLDSMDRNAKPCEDFYQYSCGGWIKNNPIPDGKASWSVGYELSENTTRYLWGILVQLQAERSSLDARQTQLRDYFSACMNEGTIEKKGGSPLVPAWKVVDSLTSIDQVPERLAELHLKSDSFSLFFRTSSIQDFDDSEQVIAVIDAGGLGLPDRDFYINEDSQGLRKQYQEYMIRQLKLMGLDTNVAAKEAKVVFDIETALAKARLSQVEQRDPRKLANRFDLKGLQALTPSFSWQRYFQALGLAKLGSVQVMDPDFIREMQSQLKSRSLSEVKTYLRWQLLRDAAPFLSQDFVANDFAFFGKTLNGIPEPESRWKRCLDTVEVQLGESLGQEFVRRKFSPEIKMKTQHMVEQIEQALHDDLMEIKWLSPSTRQKALEKLSKVSNRIGHPEKWRDYSAFKVQPDDYFGNVQRGNVFEMQRRLAKVGKPLDRGEWLMTPQSVNAYYDPQMNSINFPAGVLQAPFYDPRMDAAPNYGNTGAAIGHELIHGFDDQGRQFDAKGNLLDWWTKGDTEAFNQKAQCIIDQYAQYTIVDQTKINSRLTLGEDIADLGGVILAYRAWQAEIAKVPAVSRDGFTPDQRFFIGFAQWVCGNERPERLRVKALTDPHSPRRYRINGVLVNIAEFHKAFSCKPGQPMVKVPACTVW